MYVYICVQVHPYICMQVPTEQEEDIRLCGTSIADGCEMLDVGAGTSMRIPSKTKRWHLTSEPSIKALFLQLFILYIYYLPLTYENT